MGYMMSKDQFINEPSPATGPARWYPHVMFFVPSTDGEHTEALAEIRRALALDPFSL